MLHRCMRAVKRCTDMLREDCNTALGQLSAAINSNVTAVMSGGTRREAFGLGNGNSDDRPHQTCLGVDARLSRTTTFG